MTSTSSARTQRINLRVTVNEQTVLRRASALVGTTLTSFILKAAVTRAESMLAEVDEAKQDASGGSDDA